MTTTRHANPLLDAASRALPKRVAVIGAGTIGPDIAYYLKTALPGLALTLVDIRQEAIDAALARLRGYADKAVARGNMKASQAAEALDGLAGSTDYAAIAGCDWVIEAATEDLPLKRRIFAQVESVVGADAVITSNTSSLPAARLFAELRHPQRATVTHFFAPAWRNPAVEVIAWPGADPALVGWLRRLFAATGKLPLVTTDAPCFMLDRVFDNWCNDAALLLADATAAEVDSVAAEFVHAGPFFVLNLAHGNPIIVETNTLQADEEGEHYRPAPIFGSVDRWLTVAPGQAVEVDAARRARVRDRLLGVLWSQSVDILDRGIGEPADLDLGCRIALGFKRGPLELLRDAGDAEASRVLARFAAERPGMPMPARALAAYQPRERHVLVDRVGDVVVVTLRRPEALNALHDEMTDEVLAVIRRHEDDPAIAGFVITGYGLKAFCAGGDVGRFPSLLGDADAAAQYARECSRLLVHLDRARKPVVAALNGAALGGGFELAMRCHAIVADRGARMQLPEVTLGIVPGIGAMVVPYRRWPQAAPVFHRMLARGERLAAAQAHELGVVDALADGFDDLIARAIDRVHALAAAPVPRVAERAPPPPPLRSDAAPPRSADDRVLSAAVVALIARAVRDAAAAPTLADALEVGYRAFGEVACTAAAREGIEAFLAHRTPDFGATG
ncbi:3-hydroxyacyl-CoA dehydrogenase NAD-binding domain-containing protein [Azohydromonas sp.]|mgnify:CR=1 FL=1|uniref:3-hydroxyacyl-CoA dehydrogenase/enoyl-CoA hydratase family protein n=1 Tax=Azohydromonas sp. TaxID=1872666 RepID=UPI002C26C481|nr:3-hydroxyacyl-CoA dehydrogenase NAD-binding domain-containing protein [Azohydromonas sp.]HMM85237.1 3-hydroxyacyl-CoA dehydrogenase NAD-binding domain-containing protein [Azohydromonas sp.]